MSGTGPDPARLDELRRKFDTAAYQTPEAKAAVACRPALQPDRPDGQVIDPDDPFLQGFLREGVIAPDVVQCAVNPAPYRQRLSPTPLDRLKPEGMVRDACAEDPRAERTIWWCLARHHSEVVRLRLEMLADDAARLILGGPGRGSNPPAGWLIYLAERARVLAPAAPRSVLVTWPASPLLAGRVPYPRDVSLGPAPAELRAVTRHPAPSWWIIDLHNVFLLCRDAVDEVISRSTGNGPGGAGTADGGIPARSGERGATEAPPAPPPSEKQRATLDELSGKALSLKELAKALDNCDPSRLHRDHLKPLVERGRVRNDRKVGGYYRPDAPPPMA